MSKDQVSNLSYTEIERLIQKGRVERSNAFRSLLTSPVADSSPQVIVGQLQPATLK